MKGGHFFRDENPEDTLFSSNSTFLPKRANADLLVLHISKRTSPDA